MSYGNNMEKQLPCLTFCFLEGFKVRSSTVLDEASYMKGTFTLEDIFVSDTIKDLKNEYQYSRNEINTLDLGRCQTLCNVDKKRKKEGNTLYLKTDHDLKVFAHLKGEEFWLNDPLDFPIAIASTLLELKSKKQFVGAVMSIGEINTKVISKEEEPCKIYTENKLNENEGFLQCSKNVLGKNISQTYKCFIPQMNSVLLDKSALPPCKNVSAGNETYYNFSTLFSSFAENPDTLGCPVPCKQVIYKLSVEYYQKNNWPLNILEDNVTIFLLRYYYGTLNVEQQIESLDYDFGSFLVSAGGNLGLFLGFSCLSVLFAIIKCLKKILVNKICNKKTGSDKT